MQSEQKSADVRLEIHDLVIDMEPVYKRIQNEILSKHAQENKEAKNG